MISHFAFYNEEYGLKSCKIMEIVQNQYVTQAISGKVLAQKA